MATRTLLNEAIAEAESIREAALANAKAALEESFAPHIKELFSEKVKKMEDEKELDEMKGKKDDHDDKELDEMDAVSFRRKNSPSHNMDGEGGPVNPAPHKVGKTTIQEDEEEVELDALLAQLDEEMEEKEMKEGYDEKEMDEAKHHDDEKKMDEGKDHDDKELDEAEKAKEDEKHLHEEEEEMDVEMDDDPEINVEEMTEEELLDLIRDVIDELEEKGEIEADGGEEAEAEIEIEDEMMEGKGHDEDEVKEGVGKWKVRKEAKDHDDDLKEEKDHDDDKMEEGYGKKEDGKMEEALAEINKLKKDLQEVNLLNAKLLYSNKIFRNKNLSESQKVKVLESFDKAGTAKEAKLIFETLNEGVQTRERRRPSRGVKGSASKATKVITENKKPIVESNDMVARFQKLAGIK